MTLPATLHAPAAASARFMFTSGMGFGFQTLSAGLRCDTVSWRVPIKADMLLGVKSGDYVQSQSRSTARHYLGVVMLPVMNQARVGDACLALERGLISVGRGGHNSCLTDLAHHQYLQQPRAV